MQDGLCHINNQNFLSTLFTCVIEMTYFQMHCSDIHTCAYTPFDTTSLICFVESYGNVHCVSEAGKTARHHERAKYASHIMPG